MEEKTLFDLQLFADDGGDTSAPDTASNDDQQQDNTDVSEPTNTDDGEDYSQYDDNPNDPFHISDEVANLVLKANNINPDDVKDKQEPPPEKDDEPQQNQDTDDMLPEPTEPADTGEKDDKPPIDYKALYEEQQAKIKELEQRFANNQPVNNQQQINQATPLSQIKITPQIAKAMTQVVNQKAMEMAGLTQEDVDGLEYADEDDEKKIAYENAKQIARNDVTNYVTNALARQRQAQMQAQYEREQSIAATQNFISNIKKQDNYQALDSYITQDYFMTLNPQEQAVVRNSYQRLNSRNGTLTDNMIIKNFWNNGVNAYNNRAQQTVQANKANALNNKMTQRNKMPRVSSVPTSGKSKDGSWTIDRIKTAMNAGKWQEIPATVQKQILNGELE